MSRRTMSLAAFLVVLAGMSTFFAFTRSAGKLVRVRNALVPETIQEIETGKSHDGLSLLLGRHGTELRDPLGRETAAEWRFVEHNSTKNFYAMFDEAGKVASTGIDDPTLISGG